ncbi:MAG: DNA polymerase III subunit alpha [Actinobacteria bacterium]|uniref:DNA polymerase III subunit alpha n=1 Tax=freshwater metagenome TaxID=449393 RepID=A0A6J6NWD1_9ZZZZ|nr:DNA polymerase III subunit alpha [Actinomycetota bacterium]
MSKSFVHLHVHTDYSMLDGAAKIRQLIKEVAEQEMPAVAMTDHGNMHGAYEFFMAANDAGIKPIIGLEAYLTPGTHRTDRVGVKWGEGGEDDISGNGAYTHMTLLSETTEGMHNLFKMSSLSWLEGIYYKPRIDRELLNTYARGLIATSGCVSGEIQTRLRLGHYDEAKRVAGEMQEIFGKGNYFIELMSHGIHIEKRSMADLVKLAKELSIPLLATNDSHYIHSTDAEAHEALLCLQTGTNLNDAKRFKLDSQEFYLKSAAEMRRLFADFPEACDNTLLIAERSNVTFKERKLMPKFPVPKGETEASWFAKEVQIGLTKRFGGAVPQTHLDQAQFEIDVIVEMGFPGYFLVVADFIAWARNNGVRVGPGRGSAAGSIVAWAMGITDLDPIEHGLIFERFLNPERVSMPDIDIDFDDRGRGEVIKYVTAKYGSDRVAQIVTFNTIKAKQALKDAARVLAMPYAVGEKLTKALPKMVLGRDVTLTEVVESKIDGKKNDRFKEAAEFRELIESDESSAKVFDLARGLEGLKRGWSVHAAGVIMSAEPLIEIMPMMKREDDGAVITQFDQPSSEALGLLKMDFLGLRNLTVLDDTLANIKSNRGETVVLEELDLNGNQATYDLLSRGDTQGVFQLDGGPMRSLLRLMKPSKFEHISAAIALYRPGPMGMESHTKYALRKNDLQASEAIHAELEGPLSEILDPTYGLIVYQEQVMSAAQKAAGFSLGKADNLRRAMGKKKKEELDKMYEEFESGMKANGYSDAAVKALWDTLLPFADYAFNRAHSAAYGVISYWTAYLKANYTAEFMAALLTSVGGSKDKLSIYLSECRKLGIKVLPPDVNESVGHFAAIGEDIRFGLGAIRNVGHNVVDAIVSHRETKYKSFNDFLKKVPLVVCNKKTIDSLVKAGGFDSLMHTRRSLSEIHEQAVDAQVLTKRKEAQGQVDLFAGMFDDDEGLDVKVPDRPEWQKREKLAYEREMLGLYVSDHPLAGREAQIARYSEISLADLQENEALQDGQVLTIAGLVTAVEHKVARNTGNPYAIVSVEDLDSEVTVMLMGKTYAEYGRSLNSDQIVMIRGRVSQRDDSKNINAQRIDILENATDATDAIVLNIREEQATKLNLEELDRALRAYPGESEVFVNMVAGRSVSSRFKLQPKIKLSVAFISEAKSIFGSKVFIGGDDLVDLDSSLVGALVVNEGFAFGAEQTFFNFDDNDGVRFD